MIAQLAHRSAAGTTTLKVPSVRAGPFGSVGAMDGADAAYRDVLAAVPKGPARADGTCDALNDSSQESIVQSCKRNDGFIYWPHTQGKFGR